MGRIFSGIVVLLFAMSSCVPYQGSYVNVSELKKGMTVDEVIGVLHTNTVSSTTRSSNGYSSANFYLNSNWHVYCTFDQENKLAYWTEFSR